MNWEAEARGLLKSLVERDNLGYKMLSVKLAALGVEENPQNLSNKIQRGKFSFAFFLQVMAALEVDKIDLGLSQRLRRNG